MSITEIKLHQQVGVGSPQGSIRIIKDNDADTVLIVVEGTVSNGATLIDDEEREVLVQMCRPRRSPR